MTFETIDPAEAHRRMQEEAGPVYLDVRTVEEFAAGHPRGAFNVPIAHMGGAGMAPNEEFLAVVVARFAKDTAMVVGCKMGGRSARACEVLAAAGYTRLANVDGGFGGRPGAATDSARRGWAASSLPVADAPAPGADYQSLKRGAS